MKKARLTLQFMTDRDWSGEDPRGMFESEKYNGCRGMWDGSNLFTRGGNEIAAPAWWLAKLPRGLCLDGELWAGYGRFQFVKGTVQRKVPRDTDWREIRFMNFDLPMEGGPYKDRYARLSRIFQNDVLRVVEQVVCTGMDCLDHDLHDVLSRGGEGIMLREPGAGYEPFASRALLRVKPGLYATDAMLMSMRRAA